MMTILIIRWSELLCPQSQLCGHIVFELSLRVSVQSISPTLFEVGFTNLMCGYTFGLQSVTYCFRVTATLTSGLDSRKLCLLGAFGTL